MRGLRAAIKTLIFSVVLTNLLTNQFTELLVAVVNIQQYLLCLSADKVRRSSNTWLMLIMCDKGGNMTDK